MKAVLLSTQEGDWEGLYINGECVGQGHEFTPIELLEYADKYSFTHRDIVRRELGDLDDEEAMSCGRLPDNLSDLKEPLTGV